MYGDCLFASARSRLNDSMSTAATRRRKSRAPAMLAGAVTATAAVFAAIAVVVDGADSTRAPLAAVFRVEGLGCKRSPTRTVATIVAAPPDGAGQLLLTVAHGVVGQERVELVRGESRIPVRVVAVDTDWDLAVLQPQAPLLGDGGSPIAPTGRADARPGNATFVVFDESTDASPVAVTRTSRVTKRLRIRTEDIYLREVKGRELRPGLEVQAEARVGDSGGPLFDVNGSMIGLVWGTSRKSTARSWATRVQAADELISEALAASRAPTITRSEGLNLLACAP